MYLKVICLILTPIFLAQMMPTPDHEPEFIESSPDPFKLPHLKKYSEKIVVQISNEKSLDEILMNFPHNVILFAENEELLVNFEKLSKQVKKKYKVIFGFCQLNSSKESGKIKEKYNLNEFPQLFFFEKTKKYKYEDSDLQNNTAIQLFLNDFLSRDLFEIKTQEDFNRFYEKQNRSKLLAVYPLAMKKEKMLLEEMLKKDFFADSGPFIIGWTSEQSIISLPRDLESPSLILYSNIEGNTERNIFKYEGDFLDGHEILAFCQLNSLPLVSTYSDDTAFRIFAGPVSVQILFIFDNERDNSNEIEEFYKAARFNKEEELHYERVMFTLVPYNTENKEFLTFFGVYDNEGIKKYPKIFLTKIDNQFQRMDKYLYEKDEINEEFIKDFLVDFRKKALSRYFKSEEIKDGPISWPIHMVGSQFNKDVIRSKENYAILFCTIYDEEICKGAMKYFDEIAKKIPEPLRDSFKFAHFDIAKNEVFYNF